jgi:hypothetical protein
MIDISFERCYLPEFEGGLGSLTICVFFPSMVLVQLIVAIHQE